MWCVVRRWKVTVFGVLAARSDGFHSPSVLPTDIDVFGVPRMGNIPGRCAGLVPEIVKVGFQVPTLLGGGGGSSLNCRGCARRGAGSLSGRRKDGAHVLEPAELPHITEVETVGLHVDKNECTSPWYDRGPASRC